MSREIENLIKHGLEHHGGADEDDYWDGYWHEHSDKKIDNHRNGYNHEYEGGNKENNKPKVD